MQMCIHSVLHCSLPCFIQFFIIPEVLSILITSAAYIFSLVLGSCSCCFFLGFTILSIINFINFSHPSALLSCWGGKFNEIFVTWCCFSFLLYSHESILRAINYNLLLSLISSSKCLPSDEKWAISKGRAWNYEKDKDPNSNSLNFEPFWCKVLHYWCWELSFFCWLKGGTLVIMYYCAVWSRDERVRPWNEPNHSCKHLMKEQRRRLLPSIL